MVNLMEIKLSSVSPFSFEMCRVGDRLSVRSVKPKAGEYRGTIGAATRSVLVFKGNTKIGMIPASVLPSDSEGNVPKRCRVVRMDESQKVLAIEFDDSGAGNQKEIGS
jgi:hypothetical protein